MRNLLFFIEVIPLLSACNLSDKPQKDQANQRIIR